MVYVGFIYILCDWFKRGFHQELPRVSQYFINNDFVSIRFQVLFSTKTYIFFDFYTKSRVDFAPKSRHFTKIICFFMFFNSHINAILLWENFQKLFCKNHYLFFSGIRIDAYLTKNLELCQIWCYLLPANNVFQKILLCKSRCLAATKITKILLKIKILTFLDFFDHFERFQDARSVFNFVILEDFGSRSLKSGKIHGPGHDP